MKQQNRISPLPKMTRRGTVLLGGVKRRHRTLRLRSARSKAESYYGPLRAAGVCVGCHAMSRNGKRIAVGMNIPGPALMRALDAGTRNKLFEVGPGVIAGSISSLHKRRQVAADDRIWGAWLCAMDRRACCKGKTKSGQRDNARCGPRWKDGGVCALADVVHSTAVSEPVHRQSKACSKSHLTRSMARLGLLPIW